MDAKEVSWQEEESQQSAEETGGAAEAYGDGHIRENHHQVRRPVRTW